jgi:ketosteroid isomerase-like protein
MRPGILLLCILTVAVAASVEAQSTTEKTPNTTEEVRKQILGMEHELEQALAANDIEMLEHFYSDEFVYTNASGELLDKGQFLADLRSRKHKILEVKHDDIRLHVYENTVVVTGISTSRFEYKGIVTAGPRRFTNVYVKQEGQWKLAVHAVTDIKAH